MLATNINTIVTILGMILTVYFALKGTKKKGQRRKSHRKGKNHCQKHKQGTKKKMRKRHPAKTDRKQNVTKSQKCKGTKISLKINPCTKEWWICVKLCIEPTER